MEIPILMYHHFADDVQNDMIVSKDTFEMHMRALSESGYTTVTFDELIAYVEDERPLPEKPICITMDDGYLSNREIAFPILQKYNMSATVFLVGSMAGKTNYPITNYPIIPYFSWEQAKEMQDSGVFEIGCHTYDMHHYAPYESGNRLIRENALPLENETPEEYYSAFKSDLEAYISICQEKLGVSPKALAYPNGKYTDESEKIATKLGFCVTLTTNYHNNFLKIGKSDSLRLLGRHTITDSITKEELLRIIN